MDREEFLEFSLGCLTHVVRGTRRDRDALTFPLVLQVLGSKDCQSRVSNKNGRSKSHELRKIVTVSDGFYSNEDCFLLTSNQHIELYTVIKIHNVDFEFNLERQMGKPKISGMILDFDIIARGSDVGYISGKPISIKNVETHSRSGKGDNIIHSIDSLSSKLWKQVKEGRCCDVTFSFPHCSTTDLATIPKVKAQKNALIANSPVFEAQFEGGFSDASSEDVPIMDTEPKYMRCLLQFIFTRFVPLTSLRQAFELLYLARKYIINDLEIYCKKFIMNNEKRLAGVTDVFQYLEMNGKSCDDEISQFVWSEFRRCANVLIRQPRFLEVDFDTLETILAESELNCHEWELAQAVKRWVVANDALVKCEEIDGEHCAHQLVECIRWEAMPIKECVMIQQWEELKLFQDRSFLTDIMEVQRARDGRNISHIEVVPSCINKQYSLNRIYHDDSNFVIYTTLTVDPLTLSVTCMHGQSAAQSTYQQTKCSTIGPPFELLSFYVVPSYGLSNMSNNKVRLTVNLSCQGKSFNADSDNLWVRSKVNVTAFSFSPDFPAKEKEKDFNFWPDRDSSSSASLVFSNNEFIHYLHSEDGVQKLDLQLKFNTDINTECGGDGRASPPKIMKPLRTSAQRFPPMRPRTTYDNRIDKVPDNRERHVNSVGRTLSLLRSRRGGDPHTADLRDGWGDVNRSPQSPEWRGGRGSPDRVGDNTIEIQSPEYAEYPEAYGNITRSPQSPGSFVGLADFGDDGVDNWEDHLWEEHHEGERDRRTSSPFQNVRVSRSPSPTRSIDIAWAPYRSPRSPARSPSPQPGPSHHRHRRTRRDRFRLADTAWSSPWSNPTRNANADDDIVSCASPPCPSYSPVPVPPTYTPDAFSPPASPPRQRHSPLLLVQSFESPEYRPPSPSYSPPRSPSIIDIDLEDNEDEPNDIQNNEQSNQNFDAAEIDISVDKKDVNCSNENQDNNVSEMLDDAEEGEHLDYDESGNVVADHAQEQVDGSEKDSAD